MSVSYHSLGDKLSNTDPISNSVLISGLDFRRDGANLLRAGHYPLALLGSYIHESFHHICFRSPVGSAIAYLYHRGFLRAFDRVMLGKASPYKDSDVMEDIARVETILHIMRPLAEGIALFGEFDAWPGKSKSLSPVFRNAAIAFAEIVPDWEKLQVDDLARGVLARGRARPAARKRKENLLMQGFTTQDGGYLPGYFMVKNLQFALFRHIKSDLLLDSEFYLNFIVHWFYGDFGLVSALLDETKEMASFTQESVVERDSMNAIAVAFQRRVSQLFNLTDDQLRAFDDMMAGKDVSPWWKVQIGFEPSAAKAIEDKLYGEVNDLIDYTKPANSEEQQVMRAMCYDNFVRRNYMCVGSFDETIEIRENGQVMLAKSKATPPLPVMAFGRSEKPGPFAGQATIDVLQSGSSQRVFFTVYTDGERVILNMPDDDDVQERKELASVNLSTPQCQLVKMIMRDTINKALPPGGSATILRSHYQTQSEQSADRMYRNWCGTLMSLVGPEASIPAEAGALFEMCGRNSNFLRTVAALGCIGSPLLDEKDIERACSENDLTVAQFRERAETIEKTLNLCLLYRLGPYSILTI